MDRARGIITGVKLLGRVSKKGREYPPAVMAKALPLYEGMRVNVNHVDPGQRRSLRDRMGLVQNVIHLRTWFFSNVWFQTSTGRP